MWALATLKVEDAPDLVRALSEAAKAKVRDFNSQNIANTMWALATLKVEDAPDLVRALSEAAKAKVRDFNSQGIANTENDVIEEVHDQGAGKVLVDENDSETCGDADSTSKASTLSEDGASSRLDENFLESAESAERA